MKNNRFLSLSVFVLCFILIFSLVATPLTVNASATVTVAIGIYGATKVVVSAKAIVAMIISCFAGIELVSLLDVTDKWLEQDPALNEWANSYTGSLVGGEIIQVPLSVQESIRARYLVISPTANLSTLRVPYDLTRLEDITFEGTFGADVSSQLQTNNNLVSQSNSLLQVISDYIVGLPGQIANAFTSLVSGITTNITNMGTWIANNVNDLRLTFMNMESWVATNVDIVRQTIISHIGNLSSVTDKVRLAVLSIGDFIGTNVDKVRLAIISNVSLLNTGIQSIYQKLEDLVEYLSKFATDDEKLVEAEKNLSNIVDDYKNHLVLIMNNSRAIFSKYSNAFLAVGSVLTSFASLPVFSDLIVFSIALGCFALFVNLANTALSSSHSNSAKGKAHKSAKGG